MAEKEEKKMERENTMDRLVLDGSGKKMSTKRRTKHFTTLCTDWVHVDPKLGLLRD